MPALQTFMNITAFLKENWSYRVKHLPVMCKTQVQSLSLEDPLEKEMATHSSILAWRIPWTEEPGGLQSMGSQRVGHEWVTILTYTYNNRDYLSLEEGRKCWNFSVAYWYLEHVFRTPNTYSIYSEWNSSEGCWKQILYSQEK